jgi:hypothetical protein
MLKQMLMVVLSIITVFSGILSLLLMLEPSGRLVSNHLAEILNNRFENFLMPGFFIFLLIVFPGLFCLIMLTGVNRHRYLYSLIYGLMQCLLGMLMLQFVLISKWIPILYIAFALFIFLMSYQLRGKKIL